MKKQVFKAVLHLARVGFTQETVNKARLIHDSIDGNSGDFASPDPSLATLNAAIATVQQRQNGVRSLEQQLTTERDKLTAEVNALKSVLDDIGGYVEQTAKAANDPNLILKGGFSLPEEKAATNTIAVPTQVALAEIPQTTGVIQVRIKPVARAKAYMVRFCTDPMQQDWKEAQYFSSSKDMRLRIAAGTKIFVTVKALGPNNIESDWSDVATRIVP